MERRLSKLEEIVQAQTISNPSKSILRKRDLSPSHQHRLSFSTGKIFDYNEIERSNRNLMGKPRTRNSIQIASASPIEPGKSEGKMTRRNSSNKSPFLALPKVMNSKTLSKKRDSAVISLQKDQSLSDFGSSSSLLFFDKDRQQQSANPSLFGNSRYSASIIIEEERLAYRRAYLRVKFDRAMRKLILILRMPLISNYIETHRLGREKIKVSCSCLR